jgi:hypothetical protein
MLDKTKKLLRHDGCYFLRRTYLKKRLDVYTAKLAPKPADDDEATIDAIINDYMM